MKDWRKVQRESFSKVSVIADFLELDEENRGRLLEKSSFPFLLPKRIAAKIAKNNLNCPIARQFLPLKEELIRSEGFVMNPTCDASFQKESKLLHKYQGRVLLIASGACAMHCRYCFRQNFSYPEWKSAFFKELEYIQNDTSIHEVILSGGDPLSLSDESLNTLLQEISSIPHVRLIRFHTRFPMGIPERISPNFLAILKKIPKQLIFIIHANHIDEFDNDIFMALKSLNIPVLSQSVLLKGINDDLTTLKNLFLGLASNGIIPYYLHQIDKVLGTNHFHVPTSEGRHLIETLRNELPGYALPRYVQEIPFAPSKTPVL